MKDRTFCRFLLVAITGFSVCGWIWYGGNSIPPQQTGEVLAHRQEAEKASSTTIVLASLGREIHTEANREEKSELAHSGTDPPQ